MKEHAEAAGTAPRLRADARRNLDRLLAAARDVFAEQGPAAPLDEVARRAGVGIATLYRRFPDRRSLARAVALDVWTRAAQEARLALAEEPSAFQALARYLHRALDLRIGAVMPLLAGEVPVDEDEEVRRARDQSAGSVQTIIDAAHAEGTLRPDVAFGDTGLLLIRLSRPLPGPFPRALDDALAHRHLELAIAGLRAAVRAAGPLPGPALTLEDLRTLFPEAMPSPKDRKESGSPSASQRRTQRRLPPPPGVRRPSMLSILWSDILSNKQHRRLVTWRRCLPGGCPGTWAGR